MFVYYKFQIIFDHSNVSGVWCKYLVKSSYLEGSIFLYFSAKIYILIEPALSPVTIADPSLFHLHLLRPLRPTFS